jgi:outer membrane murein-binding lipoprotein Lpp
VPAQITMNGLGSGLDPELVTAPTRPPGTRARDGGYRLSSRRRRADAHRIVAAVLAVLALVGCVMAVLILAIQPAAARLQGQIGSLSSRVQATESQIAALQKGVAHSARQGSHLTRSLGLLSRHMEGLQRTVHGLQGSSALARVQTNGLHVCFAQLQQELSGLTLKTRSAHGHVTNVGLSEGMGPSAACSAMFGGA